MAFDKQSGWKQAIFVKTKKSERPREDVGLSTAQANVQIVAEIVKNRYFRMKTTWQSEPGFRLEDHSNPVFQH